MTNMNTIDCEFASAQGNEVVLQAGESLFVPAFRFHHIISLSINVQCNTRSGILMIHAEPMEKCGESLLCCLEQSIPMHVASGYR